MSVNDITGDPIKTGAASADYRKGYDAIWGGKEREALSYESEYLAKSRAIIRDYWETPEAMWERLDDLEVEYKGKD